MPQKRATKTINSYHHKLPNEKPQEPDPQSGNYYVSVADFTSNSGGPSRFALCLGPFPTHQEALDLVNQFSAFAEKIDPRAPFYAFGTVRMKDGFQEQAQFNKFLDEIRGG